MNNLLLGHFSILVLALLAFSGVSWAENSETKDRLEDRTGFYVAVSGVVGIATQLESDIFVPASGCEPGPCFRPAGGRFGYESIEVEPAVGLSFRGGYRALSWLAAEAQLEWLKSFDVAIGRGERLKPAAQGLIDKVEVLTFTGNVKAYPIRGPIQPFALVGVGLMQFDSVNTSASTNPINPKPIITLNIAHQRGTEFAARFGGGVDVILSDRTTLVLGGSYVLSTGDARRFSYVSVEVGLQFTF